MEGDKQMITLDRKVRVASLSILSNTLLILLKLIAGILSGSVSIISEAIHSGMDLAASLITFFSVQQSLKPADKDHPYGHGKIENISGLIEGILIFVAAVLIINEAVKKLWLPAGIEKTLVAMAVMFAAAFMNFLVSRKLYQVAQEEDSMALKADALHLKTDIYTSLGVGLGILLIRFTGVNILDSVVAILVAILIMKEAWDLCRTAINFLVDTRLSDKEEAEIEKIIGEHSHLIRDYHKLKTRKAGNIKHIDFHITIDPYLTVEEAHNIIGSLKKAMSDQLKNTRVNVHIDPYQSHIDPYQSREK
jgi:cation diffusion facilitator family transporter